MREKKIKNNIIIKLFFSTLIISGLTFGGGYVIISLMKKKFVDDYKWIDEKEILDIIALAQSCPGPIAINGAVALGYKLRGFWGSLIAVLGTIIPPIFFISIIALFYNNFQNNIIISTTLEGMQGAVGAIISCVVWEMSSGIIEEKKPLLNGIMIISFMANFIFDINVIYIILSAGLIGLIKGLWERQKGETL